MPLIDCSLPLVLQGRVYALPDVWIRPAFGGKGRKVTGTLEAHANGFRYTSPKGEELDIMYRWDRFEGYGPSLGGQPPVNAPAAWQRTASSQPTTWAPPLLHHSAPQEHQARLLPTRRQRDDCAGALPPHPSHHGGQEEDKRRAVLHGGHGLGADPGRRPPVDVRRQGPQPAGNHRERCSNQNP